MGLAVCEIGHKLGSRDNGRISGFNLLIPLILKGYYLSKTQRRSPDADKTLGGRKKKESSLKPNFQLAGESSLVSVFHCIAHESLKVKGLSGLTCAFECFHIASIQW